MSYFIVFQNKTYKQEKDGGFLWAPKETKAGNEVYYWSNMTKVNEGDIIFSVYKRKITSMNTAAGKCIDANRPGAFDSANLWEKEGRLLKADYNVLRTPINLDNHLDEILSLCSAVRSPFCSNGNCKEGYLFEIDDNLGEYITNLIEGKNKTN